MRTDGLKVLYGLLKIVYDFGRASLARRRILVGPSNTMQKIQATLIKNQVTSNSSEAHTLFEKSKFGERQEQKILYSLAEAFFLVEENKMQISDSNNKPLTDSTLLKKFCKLDKDFLTKYPVFKDLRQKGYVVKTALKFGAEFRVYDKNKKTDSHSKWLCYPVAQNQLIKWRDFVAKTRVAHSSKKNLLIAIIDEEGQPSYYETSWTKP